MNLSEVTLFFSPKNLQEMYGFMMISEKQMLTNSLKLAFFLNWLNSQIVMVIP